MRKETQEFEDKVFEVLTGEGNPVGSTWYWHKRVFGKGYDRPEGWSYRRLLKALNSLEKKGKINALRTNEDTIWYPDVVVKRS